MKSVATKVFALSAVVLSLAVAGNAQQKPMDPKDPRTGLKPGLRDAGIAASGMELVATRPRAEGFYDPKNPAGEAMPAERPAGAPAPAPPVAPAPPAPGAAPRPATPPGPGALDFANSDIAFSGQRMVIGNFHGFNAYDIESVKSPKLLASVVCPGGQGDVSIYGNLLFMSVEQTRGRLDCGVQGVQEPVSKERFRGVRIFDITDITKPKQVAAVQTCRGSHTHTLVPKDKQTLYVYGSGTGGVRSGEELQDCSAGDPKDNPNTAMFSIDVIEVPLGAPEKARVVNRPRIFMDEKTGAIAGLNPGGDSGPGTQRTSTTNQCHDITVFPEVGLAAGACSGNGILLDISNPASPKRLDFVSDKNFAYWHSATFNTDGTKVIFTDEWGGGTRPRCRWYQGGVSVFDFTDAANPVEIAYFDRGPLDAKNLIVGGYWSTYWYNGNLYASEIARGMDIFKLLPTQYLSQNEIDAATQWRVNEFNAQNQPLVKYQPTTAVAKSYVDQLNRTKGLSAERAKAVIDGLAKVDELRTGKERNAAAALAALDAVADQVAADAKAAKGRDAIRLQSLSDTLKGRTARLR